MGVDLGGRRIIKKDAATREIEIEEEGVRNSLDKA
jgi:hypothetical protein